MLADAERAGDVLPTVVHDTPSAEACPLTSEPLRTTFNHVGTGCHPYAIKVVVAALAARDMNSIVPLGVTSRTMLAESIASDCRIMMPAFAHECVF